MRAVMVMFDSLNRHMLPPYGSDEIIAPNFRRLAERTVTFDRFYAGSMPCMPARREIHTGRYNFLHRSWGPIEPWDDSMPEMLKRRGVHTHLASDHPHYWEDGGATYHTRYSTWEFFRGQEGDPWKADVARPARGTGFKDEVMRQDAINRGYLRREADHPQTRTFDSGLEFLAGNKDADEWFLQIECFDPHEPFFTYDEYKRLYPHEYDGPEFDWPPYAKVTETEDRREHARYEYKALVSMCDRSLGRVLDFFDEHGLWDDTLLLVNTDHGFLLGEHGWWAKSMMPWFDELVHLPAFLWDPRTGVTGVRHAGLVQTIDIAPTMLEFFGADVGPDMLGKPLQAVADPVSVREGALFGMHGGHVNVTDGRYVYMRATPTPENAPLEEYTLMPTHMRGRFQPKEFEGSELVEPFPFMKGIRPLRLKGSAFGAPYLFGTLLFDLQNDPAQENPIDDPVEELRMLRLLARLMRENDAPRSQFERLGIPADAEPTQEHLLVASQRALAAMTAMPLPPLDSFPRGRFGLGSSTAELLGNPRTREVLTQVLPQLANTEMISMLGDTTLYELAATVAIPAPVLEQVAQALSNL